MNMNFGDWVKLQRETRGIKTGELARKIGKEKPSYVSQLEAGRIGLPGADIRRRLASALGVTHIDVLIAAGELLPEEVQQAGIEGVLCTDPDLEELIQIIADFKWTPTRLEWFKVLVTSMADF